MNRFTEPMPNRMYKSRLFEMIFSDKTELLKLYNAMNGSDYTNPHIIQIFPCGIYSMFQISIRL